MTIMRSWRGRASAANADAYPEHFRRTVVPELERVEGFLGAELLKRTNGDEVEFLVQTRWESMEAIRRFAGSEPEKAVVEPEAVAALIDYDRTVIHYEMIEEI